MTLSRREAVIGLGAAPAILAGIHATTPAAFAASVAAQEPVAPAYRGGHQVVPLPFDPKKVAGLSERMLVSHHENNYTAAVKNLNKVEPLLATLTKETPPFQIAGLKERQLTFHNSKVHHEHYFANLGGDGKPAGGVVDAIASEYGSFARFEQEFLATGVALGGGSGWVILGFDLRDGSMRIHESFGHPQTPACALPILVMDMFEHAYQMDYGAAAAKYIEAFWKNVNWAEVDRRHAFAKKALAALTSV